MTDQDNEQEPNISHHSLDAWMTIHKDVIKVTNSLEKDMTSSLCDLSDEYDSLVKVILAFYLANPEKTDSEVKKLGLSVDKIISLKRSFEATKEKAKNTCKSYESTIRKVFKSVDIEVSDLQQQRFDVSDAKFARTSHLLKKGRARVSIINPGTVLVFGNESYVQPLKVTDGSDEGTNNVVSMNRKSKKK